MKECSWHCIGGSDQNHPQEKEIKKGKNGCLRSYKRRKVKGKGEKERYTHLNAKFQRKAGEIRKPKWLMQRNRRKQQNGKD